MALNDLTPVTRMESIFNGDDIEPVTREEYFWQQAATSGSGGLPEYTAEDVGKVLTVGSENGETIIVAPEQEVVVKNGHGTGAVDFSKLKIGDAVLFSGSVGGQTITVEFKIIEYGGKLYATPDGDPYDPDAAYLSEDGEFYNPQMASFSEITIEIMATSTPLLLSTKWSESSSFLFIVNSTTPNDVDAAIKAGRTIMEHYGDPGYPAYYFAGQRPASPSGYEIVFMGLNTGWTNITTHTYHAADLDRPYNPGQS